MSNNKKKRGLQQLYFSFKNMDVGISYTLFWGNVKRASISELPNTLNDDRIVVRRLKALLKINKFNFNFSQNSNIVLSFLQMYISKNDNQIHGETNCMFSNIKKSLIIKFIATPFLPFHLNGMLVLVFKYHKIGNKF